MRAQPMARIVNSNNPEHKEGHQDNIFAGIHTFDYQESEAVECQKFLHCPGTHGQLARDCQQVDPIPYQL